MWLFPCYDNIAQVMKPPCELNIVCVFTIAESRAKIWPVSDVYSLFIVAPIVNGGGLVLDACFAVQYCVSFLVLQSSRWGRESWLLYFYLSLKVTLLLLFFASSSRCS